MQKGFLQAIREHVYRQDLAGVMLLAGRSRPAPRFSRSRGFAGIERALLVYRER